MDSTRGKQKRRIIRFAVIGAALSSALLVGYTHFTQSRKPTIHEFGISHSIKDGRFSNNQAGSVLQASPTQAVTYTSSEIAVEKPANATVLSWQQTASPGESSLQVRTKDGDHWTQWKDVEFDSSEKDGEDDKSKQSALILANNVDGLQYRFNLKKNEDTTASISLDSTKIEGIDSREGPNGKRSLLQKTFSFLGQPVHARSNGPTIISRAEWGSPEPNSSPDWEPEYARLGRVIIHHTATNETSNSYADVRAIWQYHARSLGWGDIGYHYLVDSNGRIFAGRYHDREYARKNYVEVVGGHAYGNNVGTVGISAIGDYRYKSLSTNTYQAISNLIGFKLAPFGIDPRGNGPFGQAVIGHYQVSSTACPGTNIISQLGHLRDTGWNYYNNYSHLRFIPLDVPRWMQTANATYKRDPETDEAVDTELEPKRQLRFVDKIFMNNKWYLRTEYDQDNNFFKGIPQDELENILPTPLENPVWMELNSDRRKWNPITDAVEPSLHVFPAGQNLKMASKVTLNGVDYYRTAFETDNDTGWYITGTALKTPEFKPFETPRYMKVIQNGLKRNPITEADSNESLAQNDIVWFSSKITTDQAYFRTKQDHEANNILGFPTAHIQDLTYNPLATPYKWMQLKQDAYKYWPAAKQQYDLVKNTGNKQIKLTGRMTVEGINYLQTAYDRDLGTFYGLRESDFIEISYQALEQPRTMRVTREVAAINPKTGVVVRTVAPSDVFFATKIFIDGQWYLRSSSDTNNQLDVAIPLSALSNL